MNLDELVDKVDSKESFLEFVRALAADRVREKELPSTPYGPGALGWENGSIEAFLDAMHAWASAPANNQRVTNQPDWKTFAWILYAGKFYE
jgi:hypothetical protein